MSWDTYSAVGNKEDVSDIITNIAPYDTPLYSRIGRTRATQVIHEWLEDELGAPIQNAQTEGYTYSTTVVNPRVRLSNYTQIMHRGIHITDTQEAVQHYGLRSEIAYQMAKVLKELAFDCDQAILTQNTKTIAAPGVARNFGGLPYWIVTHVNTNGGIHRRLTFDLINDELENTWNDGGKTSILLVSARNKRVISTFTAGNTKYMENNKTHKLTQMISVLETDFGTLQCMTDRFLDYTTIYGLSPEYIKKAFLRNFKQSDLPKINDMGRRMINGEWTIEMRAEKAHFKIEDLDGIV